MIIMYPQFGELRLLRHGKKRSFLWLEKLQQKQVNLNYLKATCNYYYYLNPESPNLNLAFRYIIMAI